MAFIRTLIVDDEPLACRRIRKLLEHRSEIQLVGECGNGADAVEAIRNERPDLVFLDVQMPDLDGFGVLRSVGAGEMPVVVSGDNWSHSRYSVRLPFCPDGF